MDKTNNTIAKMDNAMTRAIDKAITDMQGAGLSVRSAVAAKAKSTIYRLADKAHAAVVNDADGTINSMMSAALAEICEAAEAAGVEYRSQLLAEIAIAA